MPKLIAQMHRMFWYHVPPLEKAHSKLASAEYQELFVRRIPKSALLDKVTQRTMPMQYTFLLFYQRKQVAIAFGLHLVLGYKSKGGAVDAIA